MRFIKTMLASAGGLLATASTALAAPMALLQDPAVKVDVSTTEGHTVWYTNPVWLVIGGIAALLIIVLAIMAARGKSDSNTTVIR